MSRSICPVLFEAEVVVAGGGPAGIAAALAAARLGKRVVLLEQTGSLGGMGTNALVPAVIYQSDGVNWVVGDFCRSIIEECCREMGIDEVNPGWQEVDAEILKRIYDDRLLKAGVKLFYMIRVADVVVRSGKLESLLVATPHGLRKVKGEVFVDATGDAAVAAFAGVPFDCGDAEGRTMSPTLCPQFSNIDIPAYDAALREGKRDRAIWHELLERGEARFRNHHFVGVCTYGNGTASGNLGHIYGANTLDETELTNAYIEGRKLAKIYHDFYRRHVPGFEHSDLVQTAPLLGVRESAASAANTSSTATTTAAAPYSRMKSAGSVTRSTSTPPPPTPKSKSASSVCCAKPAANPAKVTASRTVR